MGIIHITYFQMTFYLILWMLLILRLCYRNMIEKRNPKTDTNCHKFDINCSNNDLY